MEDRTALSDEHPETFDNRLIEDPKKVEGDIVMSESDPLKRLMSGIKPKFAAKYDFHLWPKGIIPFVVDRSIGNQMRGYIKMAMEHIHKKTCIRFRPAESNDRNYLHIFRGDGYVLSVVYLFSLLLSPFFSAPLDLFLPLILINYQASAEVIYNCYTHDIQRMRERLIE